MLKKCWAITAGAVLCAVLISGWIVPMVQEAQADAVSSSGPSAVSGEILYYLGAADGCTAIFDKEHRMVLSVLDTPLRTLPLEDRTRLMQGIPVYSEEELQQLLEDYS